ncbi:uncharacterized protein LOC129590918 [Paramacrobiotus metropolitanus]|uniref:uncharacterized protein LOC129590918 n=1 Tax=Paramacrobiotus metropolitanus TaxID=2943436 RepID=UPI0024460876|nr:uncharacterized protein LOC129590918 [Paramacrobiotus metropolitanus]
MDLDEDDEVDEEKEKDIKVRRLKVEKARMSKDVIKVYSDQRIKLKPSNCTRVKVKMGKYAPAQNKLMFTPVPQVETEVQPLAGVTDHRGKYFEIVIANHSSKYRIVKKNQLLGYVEPYEHMENVKVNAGTVKNVLEDPEVDETTKAELKKIIENLKLGPDLTQEQKNDVYNAFWEFWKVLPTSKKPYGDVKGVTHVIDTGDAKPVKCNPARTSWTGREFITKHIEEIAENRDDLWETDKVAQALNECPIKLLRFPKQAKKRYKPLPRCKVIRDWNELGTATVRIVNLQGDEEEEDDSNLQLRNKQLKDPHLPKGKVIAVKQAVPIVISASTPKERKDKQIREKAKRETSRESEASEASLPKHFDGQCKVTYGLENDTIKNH